MKYLFLPLLLLSYAQSGTAQDFENRLAAVEKKKETLEAQIRELDAQTEDIRLEVIRHDLRTVGLPEGELVEHSAIILSYSESHEQARWVAHIIHPQIIEGTQYRSNDFRVDPKVSTGTAVEKDYFLKTLKSGSTDQYDYDGFGYDRGHLAPSADFRWSAKALSESYFYSNMSPQVADFNRKGWAELESTLREYVYAHPETQLYIVTGGILSGDLPVIERSANKVSIPQQFFKVVLDLDAGSAIGFVMPNEKLNYPLSSYAVSVDEVELLTGLDFFNLIENEEVIESQLDKGQWLPKIKAGNVDPIHPPTLQPGQFNTVQAKRYAGQNKKITVVGQVVSTRYSRSGNLLLNLDRQFPDQIFSVFIRKKDLVNFVGDPKVAFNGQVVTVIGKVQDFSGVPTMNIERENQISLYGKQGKLD